MRKRRDPPKQGESESCFPAIDRRKRKSRPKPPDIQTRSAGKTVSITFAPGAGVSGTLTLTQELLLAFITDLGRVHAQMSKGQPSPPLEGKRIDCTLGAKWHISAQPLLEGSLISFHHPAYGPVAFLVPRDQVAKMVRILASHLSLPPQGDQRKN